jgi:hypothetical protein
MSTATPVVNATRARLRKLAAAHGWQAFVNADGTQDTFVRDGRRVSTRWADRGWFDEPVGRFIEALLWVDGTVEHGNTRTARTWLSS